MQKNFYPVGNIRLIEDNCDKRDSASNAHISDMPKLRARDKIYRQRHKRYHHKHSKIGLQRHERGNYGKIHQKRQKTPFKIGYICVSLPLNPRSKENKKSNLYKLRRLERKSKNINPTSRCSVVRGKPGYKYKKKQSNGNKKMRVRIAEIFFII